MYLATEPNPVKCNLQYIS